MSFRVVTVLFGVVLCSGSDLKVKITSGIVVAGHDGSDIQMVPTKSFLNTDGIQKAITNMPGFALGMAEQVMYVHDSSQRFEFTGMVYRAGETPNRNSPLPLRHMAIITHCDTGQVLELDLDNHEYRESKQLKYPSEKSFRKEAAPKVLQETVHPNTRDTGETKEFFGYPARHQITTIQHEGLFSSEEDVEEVLDGWYIDLPLPGCAPEYLRQRDEVLFSPAGSIGQYVLTSCNCFFVDEDWRGYLAYSTLAFTPQYSVGLGYPVYGRGGSGFDFWNSYLFAGVTPRGLAVNLKITGKGTTSTGAKYPLVVVPWQTSVTELSTAPLDPALFEVPAGFVKVKDLYPHSRLILPLP